MKQGIHPEYKETLIKCACGNEIEVGSTEKEMHVEVCSKCHPFYTGQQRLLDTTGRVEKFNKKYGKFFQDKEEEKTEKKEESK
jgi:large subunit ribosomal protein L31